MELADAAVSGTLSRFLKLLHQAGGVPGDPGLLVNVESSVFIAARISRADGRRRTLQAEAAAHC